MPKELGLSYLRPDVDTFAHTDEHANDSGDREFFVSNSKKCSFNNLVVKERYNSVKMFCCLVLGSFFITSIIICTNYLK